MVGDPLVIENLGWIATAVFVASYFCPGAAALRMLQMAGAAIWIAYGIVIGALPVVVANVLVFAAAAATAIRAHRARTLACVTPPRDVA